MVRSRFGKIRRAASVSASPPVLVSFRRACTLSPHIATSAPGKPTGSSEANLSNITRGHQLLRDGRRHRHGPRRIGGGTFARNLEDCGAAPEESLFVKARSRHCSSNTASLVVLSAALRPPLHQDCSTIDHHGLPGAKSFFDQE